VALRQIAEKELRRKEELDQTLEFIAQLLEHLSVARSLPSDIEQRDSVINRAMDVRSACMVYLAINIRHNATAGGAVGKSACGDILME
jgi:hypothetical protein